MKSKCFFRKCVVLCMVLMCSGAAAIGQGLYVPSYHLLDYQTGELTPFADGLDRTPYLPEYTIISLPDSAGFVVDLTIRYAILWDCVYAPGTVDWCIPGHGSNGMSTHHVLIPGVRIPYVRRNGYDSFESKVLELEYIDFPNYKLAPPMPIDWGNGEREEYEVVPFEGYLPPANSCGTGWDWSTGTRSRLYLTAGQYNYEESVVRAFTHLKIELRYSKEAALESVESSGQVDCVYYDLRGVRTACPSKGTVYIRRQGTKIDKVIF